MAKNNNILKKISIIRGNVVSLGIALGKIYIYINEQPDIEHYCILPEQVENEVYRFNNAITQSKKQLIEIKDKVQVDLGEEYAKIFESHLMILQDPFFLNEIIQRIRDEQINVEFILQDTLDVITESFNEINSEHIRERALDVYDVGRRITQNLTSESLKSLTDIEKPSIVVAKTLTPSDTIHISQDKKNNLLGIVTASGGKTSHTAILSKALKIPAIVGAENIFSKITENDFIILDAIHGNVIINPDEQTIIEYENYAKAYKERENLTKETAREIELIKKDRKINIFANIELPEETEFLKDYGAEGVGLYRTEFLYLDKMRLPSENEQFLVYKRVVKNMAPLPVTIRTLDIGGDKIVTLNNEKSQDPNPFLGLRAIRLCLNNKEMFSNQIRAILRASKYGNVSMLIPMVSHIWEIHETKTLIENIKKEFDSDGIEYSPDIKLGVMIEIPAAVVISDKIAMEVDFLSLGTNDLVQYSLAVDRDNARVNKWFQPLHPAVLFFIKMTIDNAKKAGKRVSVCGDMAEHPVTAVILLGMGIDALSMSAISIPTIKNILDKIDINDCEKFAKEIMEYKYTSDIVNYVNSNIKPLILECSPDFKDAEDYLV